MVDEDESVDLSFGLKGKVTVITGGAAGIGAAIARAFVAKAESGCVCRSLGALSLGLSLTPD